MVKKFGPLAENSLLPLVSQAGYEPVSGSLSCGGSQLYLPHQSLLEHSGHVAGPS